jgi:hypothetical protein
VSGALALAEPEADVVPAELSVDEAAVEVRVCVLAPLVVLVVEDKVVAAVT